MSTREFQERLARRARRARISLRPDLGARLETYYRLLTQWNERINLTGLSLSEMGPEALDRLLIEPLVAASHVKPTVRALIDIGSGGGSPAIPFALSLEGAHVVMVEAKTRKSVFLREALRALELARCDVITSRFEALLSTPRLHEAHDLLTIRAVRVESRQLMGLQAFVRPGGELFLFRTSAAGTATSVSVSPPLWWQASYPLLEQSTTLVVLEKRPIGRGPGVSRGTITLDR